MGLFSSIPRRNPENTDGSHTKAQHNLSTNGHVYAVQDGDQYVWNFHGTPSFRVQRFALSARAMSPSMARSFPSRLLATQNEVVDLVGRKSELDELERWAFQNARVGVRVIHAVGGQGKTRLAAQFARNLVTSGWAATEAFHSTSYKLDQASIPASANKSNGLLLVVDYADRWPTSDLIALLAAHVHLPSPLRVLLIARGTHGWWSTIEDALFDAGVTDVDSLALPTLAAGLGREGSDTLEAFRSAVAAFSPYLGLKDPASVPFPDNIGALADGHVLTLHMAALSATDATARGLAIPTGQNLSSYLLNRERNGWSQLEQTSRIKISARQMGHSSFVAALTSATTYEEGRQAVQATGVASTPSEADQVLADHKVAYPSKTPGTVLESITPDRLAEDFIALTLGADEQDFNDVWATTALSNLISSSAAAPVDGPAGMPLYVRRMVTTLVEASSRWPHVFTNTLLPLLRNNPELFVAGGGTVVSRLAELCRHDSALLSLLAQNLPGGVNIEFDQAAALIADYRLKLSLKAGRLTERGSLVNELLNTGYRFNNIGRYKEAVDFTEKAIKVLNVLAHEESIDSNAYKHGLAIASANLGPMLMRSGRPKEAVASSQAAVDLFISIASSDSGASESHLDDQAMAWSNLGAILSTVGDASGALSAAQKAVDIRRVLADPDTGNFRIFGPGLAASLSNLGFLLPSENRAEAIAIAEEAVRVFRELARPSIGDPAAFGHELAKALGNLGNLLSANNRGRDALVALNESVDIYRGLADEEVGNPGAHAPGLALSLINLGAAVSGMGNSKDAVPLTREAMSIYTSLINEGGPYQYGPELARAWNNLGHQLSEMGRGHEAVRATQNAIELYRVLADAQTGNPAAYGEYLQLSENNLRLQMSKLIS